MKYCLCIMLSFFFHNLFGQSFKVEYLIKSSDTISQPQPDYIFAANYKLTISVDESLTEYFTPKKRRKQIIKLLRQGKLVSEVQPFGAEILYNSIKDSISLWTFREFIVSDTLKNWKWQITNERKKIGEVNVIKAISNENDAHTIVWFSPEMKTASGPFGFWGLPGLILDFKSIYNNDGNEFEISGSAKKIKSFRKNIKIIKPTKGIPVKETDFLKTISIDNE